MTLSQRCFVVIIGLAISGCATFLQPQNEGKESAGSRAQLIELKEELKELKKAVEEIQFDNKNAKRRQLNLVQDLDRRLLSLERASGLVVGKPTSSNKSTSSSNPNDETVSLQEQDAYDLAFSLLKKSKYQDAINQFRKLIKTWPNSQLADDAAYWQAEARYVNRETEAALSGFKEMVNRYPDSELVPEAWLKIGYIYYDTGAYDDATKVFRDLLARFPEHQVAEGAQTRLQRIEKTTQ